MASTNTLVTGLVVVFGMILLAGIMISGFNNATGEDYSLGLSTEGLDSIEAGFGNTYDEVTGGEVEQVDSGLSLKSSWSIGKGLFEIAWGIVNGEFIYNVVGLLNLSIAGKTIGLVFRILFVALLVFSVIKLFFKVML